MKKKRGENTPSLCFFSLLKEKSAASPLPATAKTREAKRRHLAGQSGFYHKITLVYFQISELIER